MKYKLIKPINMNYNAIEQVLTNRGVPIEGVVKYLATDDNDVSNFDLLDNIVKGGHMLLSSIVQEEEMLIIIDCDADGFTSSALLTNYLYKCFPNYVENKIQFFIHDGKQHGITDAMETIKDSNFKIIVVPDAGSNDINCHNELAEMDIKCLVLDHHLCDDKSENAIVINNQMCDYPNKELSGVGVVWQFCRYLDTIIPDSGFANEFLDLVALGLTSDMMSLLSIETKHLINKGFLPENIKNPYIYSMWQKNKFKLGEHISSIDAAFYITPMVNAIQRSGTFEEKDLLFKSMLNHEAFKQIPSTKRGCKGQFETVVEQATRMSTNVKNRQTKDQEKSLDYLEQKIIEDNMLNDKVLLFLLEPGIVNKNIGGLIANKLASKYQRPCCMLTYDCDSNPVYQGSARGFEATGVDNFKGICDDTGLTTFTAGHHNAFGLGVAAKDVDEFKNKINESLKDITGDLIYYVDYIFKGADMSPIAIVKIAEMKSLWGKDLNESYVAIEGLKISKGQCEVYEKTSLTLKINVPNSKIALMKFKITEEEKELFTNIEDGYIEVNIVGKCNKNEWMGNVSPQIFIEDYEIVSKGAFLF